MKNHFLDKIENPLLCSNYNKSKTIKISQGWIGEEQIFYFHAGIARKLFEFLLKFADK